jgi:hypothetical protein
VVLENTLGFYFILVFNFITLYPYREQKILLKRVELDLELIIEI